MVKATAHKSTVRVRKGVSQWAQGDVLVILRGTHSEPIPEGEAVLVQEGEASGHNHLLYGRVAMFRDEGIARSMERQGTGDLYIGTAKIGADGAELRHEKNGKPTGDHANIKLPANSIVELRRQRQQDPIRDVAVQVLD